MIDKTSQSSRWYARYCREVYAMTRKYEEINKQAETIERKATPEENEYYMKLAEKYKPKSENKNFENKKEC